MFALRLPAWLGLLLITTAVQAQTNRPSGPPTPSANGKSKFSDRAVVIPPGQNQPDKPAKPDAPAAPGKPVPSDGVKQLVQDFQTARKTFLDSQKALTQQLKDASDTKRDEIRQQLKENLEAWLQEQKERVQELKDAAKDIKNHVPALGEVINSGTGDGRVK